MAKQLTKRVIKKSSLLAFAAIAVVLVSLIFFDISLKDAYLTGEYKKPFRDFETLNFKNFRSVTLNASTAANVIVRRGPFDVRIEPTSAHFIKISQKGDMLYIDVAFPGSFEDSRAVYPVVITCPVLDQFNADSKYMAGDQPVTDTVASTDFRWRPSFITGFTQDSLTITGKHASAIILKENKIKNLKATIGVNERSASNMIILNDNRLENADLDILNRSQLKLEDATIPNLKLQLADSAKIIYSGAARKLVKN